MLARIVHRPRGARMTSARKGKILAHRFADDFSARVEDSRHNRCVDRWNIAFENRRSRGHGRARETHVVFYRDSLAQEFALRRTLDLRFAIPSTEAVL